MGSELSTRAMQTLDNTRQAILGHRVFGEAYVVGDTTVIPVSIVRGGGGAGSGEGQGEGSSQGSGAGSGGGFGINAKPVGVYVVKDGAVDWKPAFDRSKVIIGGQVVAVVALLTVRKIFGRH
ncbi:MAG: spore germination protein GerW family protein [Acidimicrobiia bacterium]